MSYFLIIGKEFWMWFKGLIVLPVNLAKVADINKYLEAQQKLSETQQRLEKAEKQLACDAAIKAGRMFFKNDVFWAKGEDGKIEKSPYWRDVLSRKVSLSTSSRLSIGETREGVNVPNARQMESISGYLSKYLVFS